MRRMISTVLMLALIYPHVAVARTPAQPGQAFRDCPGCPAMTVVPAGTFVMGANGGEPDRYEGPAHAVTIARPFAVGRYEITVAEYRAFTQQSGYPTARGCAVWDGRSGYLDERLDWRDPGLDHPPLDRDPVVCVSWDDAVAYTKWLARKTGKPYRLLSEAEWEYVARPAPDRDLPWSTEDESCRMANVYDHSADPESKGAVPAATCDDGYPMIAPVGSYPPNRLGLYDIVGNVWEWVQDCYAMPYPAAPADGSAQLAIGCDRRGVRGGSFRTRPDRQRVTFRGRDPAHARSQVFGFRVARDIPSAASAVSR